MTRVSYVRAFPKDLVSGLVVFLIALPLCLGIALASNAPLMSGVMAGVVGGLVVSLVSGSHTSVSGPAAGLTAIVLAQITALGSFETFLVAVVLAGFIQVGLGVARAGFIKAFFPTSVIKGLLAAIGIILILKQIPHVVGHDPIPIGEMSFRQTDGSNTFTELLQSMVSVHPGAAVVGLISLALLFAWDRTRLKHAVVPAPLAVVLLGVGLSLLFRKLGGGWEIGHTHLVRVPAPDGFGGFVRTLRSPDFSQLANPAIYVAALTIAMVASLETLLNLEAVDKLDPAKRVSPPDRELIAQGVGNIVSGLVGGLPLTAVIVRGSANINAGAKTRMSSFIHGALLLSSVVFFPGLLNAIPLAALAAILLMTGVKLASPAVVRKLWSEGVNQFMPFAVTVAAIVLTDLIVGVLLGLGTSLFFILRSNFRRPLRRFLEKHAFGDLLRIELAHQVSFLNRAMIARALDTVPAGGHVLIDARSTDYIDPDVLDLIRGYRDEIAPARGVAVSMVGFKDRYAIDDHIQYVDVSTREIVLTLTPGSVLHLLKEGNDRFLRGERISRDLMRQVGATASEPHPMAVVLGCIDSRTSTELVFDLGLGDIYSVRVSGNIVAEEVLGSLEHACAVAGAKLIVVLGHTRCEAVKATVDLVHRGPEAAHATGCVHMEWITSRIARAIESEAGNADDEGFIDRVARQNVRNSMDEIPRRSRTLGELIGSGRVALVGAIYDVRTGRVEFLDAAPVTQATPVRDRGQAQAAEPGGLFDPTPDLSPG